MLGNAKIKHCTHSQAVSVPLSREVVVLSVMDVPALIFDMFRRIMVFCKISGERLQHNNMTMLIIIW